MKNSRHNTQQQNNGYDWAQTEQNDHLFYLFIFHLTTLTK